MHAYINNLSFNLFKSTVFFFNKTLELVIIFAFLLEELKLNSYNIMKLFPHITEKSLYKSTPKIFLLNIYKNI